jgi:aminopeptidase N
VLSTNTYQKAGWVLHMLRHQLGDADFWKGIRQYYEAFKYGNAMTGDFQRTMEAASGKNLSLFFDQWIYEGGHPKITGTWRYDAKTSQVMLEISQVQSGIYFRFPLDLKMVGKDGKTHIQTIQIDSKTSKTSLIIPFAPQELTLDPDTWLLFEGSLVKK